MTIRHSASFLWAEQFNRICAQREITILEVTRNQTKLETTHLFSAVIPELRILLDTSSYLIHFCQMNGFI